MMSKYEKLTAFVAVVEQSSFLRASRLLNITNAAISKKITSLEADLGVKLIDRNKRRFALTEIGQRYYTEVKHVIQVMEAADAIITQTQKIPAGKLNVTCTPYFAEKYLIPHLAEFTNAHPQITLHLELTERVPDLSKEKIDVSLGLIATPSEDLVRRSVDKTRYVLCAAPSYIKKFGAPKEPTDLSQHRIITHSFRKPNNRFLFPDGTEVYFDPFLYISENRSLRRAAIAGIGIVKLLHYVVAEPINKKQLIEVLPDFAEPEIPVYLFYQHDQYLQPKIRCFVDFIVEKVGATVISKD